MWLKPKALWAYKHARWKPCCCGIFCSRFHPILSPLKIILEMVFWTSVMLDFICTWLEKTRRFCTQVIKISRCFWMASTCVQRSSFGWCSRLTYMETVDWMNSRKNGIEVLPTLIETLESIAKTSDRDLKRLTRCQTASENFDAEFLLNIRVSINVTDMNYITHRRFIVHLYKPIHWYLPRILMFLSEQQAPISTLFACRASHNVL